MSLIKQLLFNLWYLRHPPWESGIIPPEVEAYIAATPPGRALDLGCGSGTSSLALARAGWAVSGVDFAARAIRMARRKAARAGLHVDFHTDSVTRLHKIHGPFDLVLDIGCFHGLYITERVAYLHNLDRLLASGGTWLLYAFVRPAEGKGAGLTPDDLEIARLHLTLNRREDGTDIGERPSAWFWFRKP
ncbi:MAG: class I SAM-dependent methyltransferase [Anaerolineales bacterium]|nr:class I SAM-dependent methyltransferase [Anaerolineales bacterium]